MLKDTSEFSLGNRRLEIQCTAGKAFLQERQSWLPWGIFLGSLVLTSLVWRSIDSSLRRTSEIEQLVRERTAELTREIEQRKQIEEDLRKAREHAEVANKSKSEFLANMSHELRTPLNAVIGFSEILADGTFGEINARQEKYVNNIMGSGRHLLQLINDILDLSKVEAGRLELDCSDFDVAQAASDVTTIVQSLANKKGTALVLDIGDDLPEVHADQTKFKQLLYNLLSNAIKYTPEKGEVILKAEVISPEQAATHHVSSSRDTAFLMVSVRDSGIGIKEADIERVFGVFEQLDASYAREQEGTGLGLALTRSLVELHGGKIWVESEGEGKGSVFTFIIPTGKGAVAASPITETKMAQAIARRVLTREDESNKGPAILVVEDDPPSWELIAHYLQEEGYRPVHASDGEMALQLAREIRPSAIVLDLILPKKDGLSVLQELKSDEGTRDIPVVIVSITGHRKLGLSLGAVEYLMKPIDRHALIEIIRNTFPEEERDQTPRVLIVDDDSNAREMVRDTIKSLGMRTMLASGGQEAIEKCIKHRPDLVILDLMMPGVTGFDVVDALRQHPATADVPIIINTAKDLTDEDYHRLNGRVQKIAQKNGKEGLMKELAQTLAHTNGNHVY